MSGTRTISRIASRDCNPPRIGRENGGPRPDRERETPQAKPTVADDLLLSGMENAVASGWQGDATAENGQAANLDSGSAEGRYRAENFFHPHRLHAGQWKGRVRLSSRYPRCAANHPYQGKSTF